MYLTPAGPLRSLQSLTEAHLNGRLLIARHNAIQARRTLTALGYMGISAPFVRKRRHRLTAMGCSQCRTGLTWLGQDDDDSGIDVSSTPIATDLVPTGPPDEETSAGISTTLTAPTAPQTISNPMLPVQQILSIGAASGLNTTTGLPIATSLQPPAAPSALPLIYNPALQTPTGAAKPASSTILGMSPTTLAIAGGAIILLGVLAGRR
jgi:hypothetical protein